MHRRQFLAVLGATAAGGCSSDRPSAAPEPTTASSTETRTTAEPTTARPSETRTTSRPERTSTRGAELIERGRAHLRAAVEAFVEPAGGADPTILDVSAATTEFSRFDVNEEYRSAKRRLTDAKNFTGPANTALADDLLAAAEYVDTLGFAQLHLVNAYEGVSRAMRALYTENYADVPEEADDVTRQRASAEEYVATIRASFDESTVDVVDAISGDQYAAKLAQFDRELAAFEAIAPQLAALEAPFDRFRDNVGHYTTDRYDEVAFVTRDFEAVQEDLASIEPADSVQPVVDELRCAVGAMVGGVDEMRNALLDRRNGDHGSAREFERAAEAEFESCETLVREVEPVADLLESIPR